MKLSVARLVTGVVAFAGAVSVGGLFAGSLDGGTQDAALAAGDPGVYKALYTSKCGACHNLPDPTIEQNTKARWRGIVTAMSEKAAAAGAPISDDDQKHIVDYLGLFPPKAAPGSNDPLATRHEDVWSATPEKSLVYTFYSADQLTDFNPIGATAGAANDGNGIAVTARAQSGLLIQKGATLDGGLDLRVQLRLPDIAGSPRTGGAVFAFSDPRNYYDAVLDLGKGEVRLEKVTDGTAATVATGPMGDIDEHTPWHTLRVMYRPDTTKVSIWIDASKKVVAPVTAYTDGGGFGVIAQGTTRAGFRNLYADIYGK